MRGIRLIIAKPDDIPGIFPAVLINCRIMLACRVDILVSKNVRNKVDVSSLPVQACPVGAPELVGSDLFQRRGKACVLFYQIFNSADRDPSVLEGKKECFFVSFLREDLLSLLQIIL